MARKAQLQLNLEQLELLEKALLALLGLQQKNELGDWCFTLNTQPSATSERLMKSDSYQTLLKECENGNAILKQVKYQKDLLQRNIRRM